MKDKYKEYLIDKIHTDIVRIFGIVNIEALKFSLRKYTIKKLRSTNSDLSDFLLKYNFLIENLISSGKEKDLKICREINLKISKMNPYDVLSKDCKIYTGTMVKLNKTVNKHLRG